MHLSEHVILSVAKNPAKQIAFPRPLRERARVRVNWLKFQNRRSRATGDPISFA